MARRSAFRRAISILVMAPATIILVLFAVSNRESVVLSLWPLSDGVATPLYLLVLALFALGALIGMAIAWFSGAETRRSLREARARAERAERENLEMRPRVDELDAGRARQSETGQGGAGPQSSRRSLTTMA